jgi:hypothetical protein
MSKVLAIWRGTGFDKNASLTKYEFSDGTIHYTFYDRLGHAGNPNEHEAEQIIREWRLEEVEA